MSINEDSMSRTDPAFLLASPDGESAVRATALTPELALARAIGIDQPAELFSPRLGFRPVQALAENTRRAYRADWAAFVQCCALHGHLHLPAMPAAIETFIE